MIKAAEQGIKRKLNLQLFAEGGEGSGDAGAGSADDRSDKGATSNISELLGEELYGQIKDKLGDDNELVISNNGQWIPKAKFDSINTDLKTYKDQISGLNTTIKDLQGKAGDNTELSNKLQAMQDDIAKKEAEIKDVKIDGSIKMEIAKLDPKDMAEIMVHIKRDQCYLSEDGKVMIKDGEGSIAVTEKIKEIHESKPYLFNTSDPKGTGGAKGAGEKKTDPLTDPFLKGFIRG